MLIPLYVPYPTLTFATVFLAEELGYLSAAAPNVRIVMGGMERYAAVLKGQEPGIVLPMSYAVRAYNFGGHPRVFCSVFDQVVHRLVAKPEVRSLADLRGRMVMVNVFGGTSDLEARTVLRRGGVDPGTVQFVEAGPDLEMAQLRALRLGEVDAIASSAPFWYVAQQEGFVVLGDAKHYSRWLAVGLIADEQWITTAHETVPGLTDSLRRATHFLRSAPRSAAEILASRIPEFSEEVGGVIIGRLSDAWNTVIDLIGLDAYVRAFCSEFRLTCPRSQDLALE